MAVRDRIRSVKHLQNKNFICVLENPKDSVNLSSAIRNISAFGVEKLYVIAGKNDIPKLISDSRSNKHLNKMSVGASKWVYIKHFDTTQQCIDHLKKEDYVIAVTSSHIKGQNNIRLYDEEFTQKKLSVWFGNESRGISDEAVEASDLCIQIPMGGIVESLNLGTSTGIILSYISYQRLRYVFDNKKTSLKPRGKFEQNVETWDDFIDPKRS